MNKSKVFIATVLIMGLFIQSGLYAQVSLCLEARSEIESKEGRTLEIKESSKCSSIVNCALKELAASLPDFLPSSIFVVLQPENFYFGIFQTVSLNHSPPCLA